MASLIWCHRLRLGLVDGERWSGWQTRFLTSICAYFVIAGAKGGFVSYHLIQRFSPDFTKRKIPWGCCKKYLANAWVRVNVAGFLRRTSDTARYVSPYPCNLSSPSKSLSNAHKHLSNLRQQMETLVVKWENLYIGFAHWWRVFRHLVRVVPSTCSSAVQEWRWGG